MFRQRQACKYDVTARNKIFQELCAGNRREAVEAVKKIMNLASLSGKVLTGRQYGIEAFQGPIDFFAGNHQRRRNANGVAVRILTEDAQPLELLAVLAGPTAFGQQFDPDHQSFTPDFFYERAGNLFQSLQEIFPH